jgi:Electron transfer DM13
VAGGPSGAAARRDLLNRPARLGAAALVAAIVTSVAWYLASPLFVRTYTNEALPSASAAAATGTLAALPTASDAPAPRILASGELGYVDAIHNGKGQVRVVEVAGRRVVRFEDVAITNAPDVHVYLSRETGGRWDEATSLYLGALKATNGSFNYELPETVDVAGYRSVVVWCRAFRVLITWADLQAG